MKRSDRNFWIESIAIFIVIAAIVASVVYSKMQPMAEEDLAVEVSDLRSLCSAGVGLSEQHSSGDLTDAFFYNQMELMEDNVRSIRHVLDSTDAEPQARPPLEKARDLAHRLDIAFFAVTEGDGRANELPSLVAPLKRLEEDMKQQADK
jgi:hypothetical protein